MIAGVPMQNRVKEAGSLGVNRCVVGLSMLGCTMAVQLVAWLMLAHS